LEAEDEQRFSGGSFNNCVLEKSVIQGPVKSIRKGGELGDQSPGGAAEEIFFWETEKTVGS